LADNKTKYNYFTDNHIKEFEITKMILF